MLWLAQFVSNIGTFMQGVGAVWVLLELHQSPAVVALVQTAVALPVLLLGVPAGALADLIDRRRLLLATQGLMLAAAAALAVLTWTGSVTPAALLGLTFALGVGTALNGPAWQAVQPELVPAGEFPQAVTLGGASMNLGRAIGPALAGVIIAATGPGLVFLLNALSFLAVIGALAAWRPKPENHPGPPEQFDAAVRAGLRYAWHSHLVHYVLLRSGAFTLASAGLLALLPVYAKSQLDLGSGGLGLLYAAFGAGAAGSALLLPRIRARIGVDGVVVTGTAAAAVTLLALAFTRSPVPAALITFVAGAGWLLCLSVFNLAAQQVLPDWVRARGLALNLSVTAGATAVGSAAWGAVANVLGISGTFGWESLAVALTLLAGVRWRFSPIATYDLSPASLAEPDMPLAVPVGGGPVFVTVTYRVRPGAEDDFQEAMQPLGWSRRRTGAVRWSVLQHAESPGQFVEMFVVASWDEYLRQQSRRTAADAALDDRLRAFLRAGTEPDVERFLTPPKPHHHAPDKR
jgi:MFS family permease